MRQRGPELLAGAFDEVAANDAIAGSRIDAKTVDGSDDLELAAL